MSANPQRGKVYQRLKECVNKDCEVTLTNGEVINGNLDSFTWPSLNLVVDGKSRHIINWAYVIQIRFAGMNRKNTTRFQ